MMAAPYAVVAERRDATRKQSLNLKRRSMGKREFKRWLKNRDENVVFITKASEEI